MLHLPGKPIDGVAEAVDRVALLRALDLELHSVLQRVLDLRTSGGDKGLPEYSGAPGSV